MRRGILAVATVRDPRSKHYADQTRLFSQKKWLPMRFTDRSIRRDKNYERTVVSGRR